MQCDETRGAEEAHPTAGMATAPSPSPHSAVAPILGFFYSIHYQFGMALERAMCQDQLSRQQAAILWIVHSEAGNDGWVRRRAIELALKSWFECSNSRVSKLLKELSSSPLPLIRQEASPGSKREKIVSLTQGGKDLLGNMQQAGRDFFASYFAHMWQEEMHWGHQFLSMAFAAHTRTAPITTKLPPPPLRLLAADTSAPPRQVTNRSSNRL
ncbi:MarR family winged helix-turn-helix transcriptional regulator [Pseudomonas sp. GD03721]|uniref:MarR family winged helix-turn-helix transcriptional regulator n=1 Tax=Pseudomonas TaxID=286 RepID=UPI000940535C|nr:MULTISPECIES: MarR family winged helix-turn-helix transcriptional regulator [Pseudomonas]MDH0639351.1 MarR family winged helix-turn-helix transcriptional regulator [Pseudomonas sp. GD03860]MDH1440462.1 MarR family winged helix-turn-helix transcriptional regulator [Pseudomonas sp. GD03722]WGG03450.1 MarR family winged helix-turn-helix transcriptional regulator [Pseudomonas sp. GD03721]WGG07618.1 MarR family winged helix-turn-helix transcriptional regulator [Pseudomonas sp. GD03919]